MAGCALQVGGCSSEALGFLPTLRDIVRKDGALALYKCALPHSLLHSPLHELLSGPLTHCTLVDIGFIEWLSGSVHISRGLFVLPPRCMLASEACMQNHMF